MRSKREYRLGFIAASRQHQFVDQSLLHGWQRILTPGYKLFIHPDTPLHQIQDVAGRTVLLIGDAFVAHGTASLDDTLIHVARGNYEPLDDLSGRFALFILHGEKGRLMQDPLGSQAVFRTLGERPVVSSHSSLLAECNDYTVSRRIKKYMSLPEYRARVTRFLPGDLSLYDEIVHLTPNNELDLRTGDVTRFWPRGPIPPSRFSDLLSVWDEYFTAYVKFLTPRYRPIIGLTGGLDSRAVIATVSKKSLGARYITWDKMPTEEARRIPSLAEHLGGHHSWIRMDERPESSLIDEIRQAAKYATGLTRGTPLLPAQIADSVAVDRALFLKGLGGEVMRGPFNSRTKPHLSRDNEDFAYALYAGQVRLGAGAEYEEMTRKAVRDFLDRANYSTSLHEVDVGDLIYWEQRMGTWTAIQHAEFSVVLNSHSAMNSRRLFSTAWGMPDRERFGPGLLQKLIHHYDPTLAGL